MELCIKTVGKLVSPYFKRGFNPCFNGTMYKNWKDNVEEEYELDVSILVLMELCIKTSFWTNAALQCGSFQSLF